MNTSSHNRGFPRMFVGALTVVFCIGSATASFGQESKTSSIPEELEDYVICWAQTNQMKVDPQLGWAGTGHVAVKACKHLAGPAAQAMGTSVDAVEGLLLRELIARNPGTPELGPAVTVAPSEISPTRGVFDFKGIFVGGYATPDFIKQKLGVDCGTAYGGGYVCNGVVTIAEAPAQMNLVINLKGTVQRITLDFQSMYHEPVLDSLTMKFGKPTSTNIVPMSNLMGARLNAVFSQWEKDGSRIEFMSHGGAPNRSYIIFLSQDEVRERKETEAKRKTDL